EAALERMRQALAATRVVGVTSNAAFLQRLVAPGSAFSRADLDTGLIEREHRALLPPRAPATPRQIALATLAALLDETAPRHATDPFSPWATTAAWRLTGPALRSMRWHEGDELRIARIQRIGDGWEINVEGEHFSATGTRERHLLHACLN